MAGSSVVILGPPCRRPSVALKAAPAAEARRFAFVLALGKKWPRSARQPYGNEIFGTYVSWDT